MQFVKLRITGFKSFVDSTELLIGEGLTGVVGPNGCGKSNLVEALRWVMGENSAKRMRGGAMDDVIFSGTQSRPPRNLAEVALIIDNGDRTAPAAFNEADEIEISRTLERESGSAYRLNGNEVRARDIQLLFADATSGAHSPALVSQGSIGAIVNAKPTERRALLEEAAGISGLHSRRHEAELRLRGAETNLERLDDVMETLSSQLTNINRQARQARRYRKLGSHIRRAEGITFYLQFNVLKEQLLKANGILEGANKQVVTFTEKTAEANILHLNSAEELPSLRSNEVEAGAILHRLMVARETLEEEDRRTEQTREQIVVRNKQIESDKMHAISFCRDAETEINRLQNENTHLTEVQSGEQTLLNKAVFNVKETDSARKKAEEELEVLMRELTEKETTWRTLKSTNDEICQQIERLKRRLEHIEKQKDDCISDAEKDGSTTGNTRLAGPIEADLIEARESLVLAEDEAINAEELAQASDKTLLEMESNYTRMETEEKTLSRLYYKFEDDLFPPLVEKIQVEAGFEGALGAALGDDLDAPINEAAPVHWREIEDRVAAPPIPRESTPLDQYVKAPGALSRRLAQIGVVPEADGDRLSHHLLTGQRLVSKEGSLWRWDGYVARYGAETVASKKLEQRARLKVIRAQKEELLGVLTLARKRSEIARKSFEASKIRLTEARKTLYEIDQIRISAIEELNKLEQRVVARKSRLIVLDQTQKQVLADIKDNEKKLIQIETYLAKLENHDDLKKGLLEVRDKVEKLRLNLSESEKYQDHLLREIKTREDRSKIISQEIQSWRHRLQNTEHRIEELQLRENEAAELLEEIKHKPQEIVKRRAILLDEISIAEQNRSRKADKLIEKEKNVKQNEKLLREAERLLGNSREDRIRAESSVQQMTETHNSIIAQISEKFDCNPQDVLAKTGFGEEEKLPTQVDAERQLERLVRERDQMGPVNLRAEVEAKHLSEQLETLEAERKDLQSAINRLRGGIGNLNREGRERLLAAFHKVDKHFQDLFIKLFGGGKAHLTLAESEDPLEAGLEIMARPPGKRLQHMSLLSGGEQALTALALLFSVFSTNPAPVCVLDEVDAPLDDANVERFCNLVTEIARATGTRFIIVTHHPFTMARMDRLFGITMAERGVSQLISIDLSMADRLEGTA